MIIRIAILFLLCSASLPLLASEENRAAPDGGEGCPTAMAEERANRGGVADTREDEADPKAKGSASQSQRGGNAENSVRGPRMHNLLPGMFR